MPSRRSDLPFGSEFSPAQIDLGDVLEFARQTDGDWRAFEAKVRERYFQAHDTSDYNRGKLANNTRLGMIAYGVVDRQGHLTELGHALWEKRATPAEMYAALARHILLKLHGMTLVQCVADVEAAGETVDLVKLREWLDARGVHFPRGGRHPSSMRGWLEKAGVFHPGSWRVDQARLREVAGLDTVEFEALRSLRPEQQAFLRALVNLSESGPFQSNQIEKLATATYGVRFNEKSLAKDVLYPLEAKGYVSLTRGTKGPGRGAKPFSVATTEKLEKDILVPILDQVSKQVGAEMLPLLRRTLGDIIAALNAADKYQRGLALEALAFRLMRLVDLDYVATRLRGTVTGGAEVDVIVQSARFMFSRWQIQCKNVQGGVSLDDVATQVGLTYVLNTKVVLVVSAGAVTPQARRYAKQVMDGTGLQIALLARDDLDLIATNPAAIVDVLVREARNVLVQSWQSESDLSFSTGDRHQLAQARACA
ncbi:MAG: restriction endonuclease [Chloroflexi bacterium]|nr:restriction endonuclease [Chloroflexota bacterium]